MIQTWAGILSSVPLILAAIYSCFLIVKRRMIPERITYFIWLMLDAVYVLAAFGSRGAIWYSLASFVLLLPPTVLSFKFGVGGHSRFDLFTLGGGNCRGDFVFCDSEQDMGAGFIDRD
ncbi:MAG: hypothetical protein LBM73_02005 [Candidatus Nomurabacteria bacterium]|nr:hypothetical protein [Candidatus Nomurabacteria bacterium]